MRILFLDAYFYPEQIAFTHLEDDLLQGLVDDGHEIIVVCPSPTRGVDKECKEKYKKIKYEELYDSRVHVIRFLAPQEGKNPFIRALRYFWCNIRTYIIGKKIKNIDLVFANSTPPTQGWIAGKVAKKLMVPFVYSLQDVFPDSMVTTGLTKEGSFLWKIGRLVEKNTYKRSEKIIVISNDIKSNLKAKGVNEEKIDVVSNWIDVNAITPISREENKVFDEYKIDRSSFIVLYAGNFGAAQGAEIILDVAERLKEEKNIHFVIFGGGLGYEEAKMRAKDMPNVSINPLLPQDRVSEVYSMGDITLITCKKGVGKSGMPSKTWSIMACNSPIIASFDKNSELDYHIKMAGAGFCVEPESIDDLAKAIDECLKNRSLSNKTMTREYVIANASKEKCVTEYIKIFEESIERNLS